MKAIFSKDGATHYISMINGIDNDLGRMPFGRRIEPMQKIAKWKDEARHMHVSAKSKTMATVIRQWIKDIKPSECFCTYKEDNMYKDDSILIYYKD